MEKQKYLDDLQDIRTIMDRSSRFISLSGMSGVIAGVLALLGAYSAYQAVYENQNYLSYRRASITSESLITLLAIASSVLILSLLAGILLTRNKARKTNQKLWDSQSQRLLINLFIPLAVGGILCLILLSKGFIGLIAPLTLVFYGLALINASKYTLSEIRSLGIIEVALGLIGCQFVGYGLILWALGFGILHIIYGIVMHVKYDS
jgi:hypothetical protein